MTLPCIPNTANMKTKMHRINDMYRMLEMHSMTVDSSTRREVMDLASFRTRSSRNDRNTDVEPLVPPVNTTPPPPQQTKASATNVRAPSVGS